MSWAGGTWQTFQLQFSVQDLSVLSNSIIIVFNIAQHNAITDHRAVPAPLLVLAVRSFINKHCSLLCSHISSLQSRGKVPHWELQESNLQLNWFHLLPCIQSSARNTAEIMGNSRTQANTETYSLQSISGQMHQRTTVHCEQLTSDMLDSNLFHNGFRDRAAGVTLCFRPEILVLWKSKKEKWKEKNSHQSTSYSCTNVSSHVS